MELSRPKYWGRELFPSAGDLSSPEIEPRSPALQADSLPAEPPRNPKNTGVGSLSFLQWIFPTQESNWSLLHCRWILYQLSYQGIPIIRDMQIKTSMRGFPAGSAVKNPPANAGETGSVPDLEELTCWGATEPMHHNYCTCVLQAGSHNCWAHVPQVQSLTCLEAPAPQWEKPPQREACNFRVVLACHN